MSPRVEFASFTPEEQKAVDLIIRRAMAMYRRAGVFDGTRLDLRMDLAAVHARTPLRLAEMAKAPAFDLAHDVVGIRRHLNRETGELEDFFVPRFRRPS